MFVVFFSFTAQWAEVFDLKPNIYNRSLLEYNDQPTPWISLTFHQTRKIFTFFFITNVFTFFFHLNFYQTLSGGQTIFLINSVLVLPWNQVCSSEEAPTITVSLQTHPRWNTHNYKCSDCTVKIHIIYTLFLLLSLFGWSGVFQNV